MDAVLGEVWCQVGSTAVLPHMDVIVGEVWYHKGYGSVLHGCYTVLHGVTVYTHHLLRKDESALATSCGVMSTMQRKLPWTWQRGLLWEPRATRL